MNRYPTWGYALIAVAIVLAFLYTVPNFYGESPAVQVAAGKATVKVDAALLGRVEEALKKAGIAYDRITADPVGIKVRFADADAQLRAYDLLNQTLNPEKDSPSYAVALNLLPASPNWLAAINATPMTLGLDLRGGVHFLLQVDMKEAVKKRLEAFTADIRQQLRDRNIRHTGVTREGDALRVRFADAAMRAKAYEAIGASIPDLALAERDDGQGGMITATIRAEALKRIQESALKQNISTLNNRVNGLGVSEPVIQQQGADRIAVQLPGVQDPVRAREILGRTATLEVRLVDEEAQRSGNTAGADVFPENRRDGVRINVPVKRQVVLTGDQFIGAGATFDNDHRPAVSVDLDPAGGRVMRQVDAREPQAARWPSSCSRRARARRSRWPPSRASSAAASRSPATSARWRPTTCRCSSARARSPRRWRSSRSAPSARAWARTTSSAASTPRCGASSPSWCS